MIHCLPLSSFCLRVKNHRTTRVTHCRNVRGCVNSSPRSTRWDRRIIRAARVIGVNLEVLARIVSDLRGSAPQTLPL